MFQALGNHVADDHARCAEQLGRSRCGQTHRAGTGAEGPGSGQLKAPMDGAVIEVNVAPGDTVEKGQTLAVLEAMKMEHALKADRDGRVERVEARAGDQVKRQQLLIVVENEL